jgi:Putative peptidoglycan binding domain
MSRDAGSPEQIELTDQYENAPMSRPARLTPLTVPQVLVEGLQGDLGSQPATTMGTFYRVQRGDCLSSIAEQWGFSDYNTIYRDSGNDAFRQKRPNPNIIYPEDVLFIPDRRSKELARPTDQLHRFVLKQPKVLLRLCLKDDLHQPYQNKRYHLRVGSHHHHDSTNENGMLEHRIPANAFEGEITIFIRDDDPSDQGYTFTLNLGHLDPVDETSGVDARLTNLGFAPLEVENHQLSNEERVQALKAFQDRFGLEVTGQADEATRQKLRELHDAE